MSKIIDSIWFTGSTCIGIVVTENEVGERKAYIAQVPGVNPNQDEEYIKTYGAPVTLESLVHIEQLLRKDK